MKREGIAYGPVIGYTALLIAASGALGWVVTGSWYPLAILLVPVIGIAAYRLIGASCWKRQTSCLARTCPLLHTATSRAWGRAWNTA